MILVRGLCFSYGSRMVLHDISLELQKGEFLAVLGENGAGKSTLVKCLAGLLNPSEGDIAINGQRLTSLSRQELAKVVAYLPQNCQPLDCTVFEAVLIGRRPYLGWQINRQDMEETARILELTGLLEYADRCTMELSGGELQRVAMARTLAQKPSLLLLDEPVNHLDIRSQIDYMALVRSLAKQLGIATVAVMHDLNLALRFADSFMVMQGGGLLAAGGREIITGEIIEKAYRLKVVMLEQDGLPVVIPCPEREPSILGG